MISVIAVVFALTGCRGYAGILPKSKTYVQQYIIPDKIELNSYFLPNNNQHIITISFSGRESNGNETIEIGKKYGDTHYNKRLLQFSNIALDKTFSKVDIISNADFNSYPAGTSLAHITRFSGASPYPFISRGYKGKYDWNRVQEGWEDIYNPEGAHLDGGYSPVNEMISDLNEQNLKMLHPDNNTVRFTETPSIKLHTFTITFYEGGNEYSGKIDIDFSGQSV